MHCIETQYRDHQFDEHQRARSYADMKHDEAVDYAATELAHWLEGLARVFPAYRKSTEARQLQLVGVTRTQFIRERADDSLCWVATIMDLGEDAAKPEIYIPWLQRQLEYDYGNDPRSVNCREIAESFAPTAT